MFPLCLVMHEKLDVDMSLKNFDDESPVSNTLL